MTVGAEEAIRAVAGGLLTVTWWAAGGAPMTYSRLAPAPVASAGPMLFHQTGRLQGLFEKAVRHRDAVLAAGNLMKMPDIEALVALSIQP